MPNKFILPAIYSLLCVWGCREVDERNFPSVGKLGELVVVTDKQGHNQLKECLDTILMDDVPYLATQNEPVFELLRPDIRMFRKYYSNHKTILVLITLENYSEYEELLSSFSEVSMQKWMNNPESKPQFKRDLFVRYQHIVYVFGKDYSDLERKLVLHRQLLVDQLIDYELVDYKDRMFGVDTTISTNYFKEFKAVYGVGVEIPSYFKLKSRQKDFWWFQQEAVEKGTPTHMNLVVHAYPYKDSIDFTFDSIRSRRDTVFKYNIPGPIPGTYMGTSDHKDYGARFLDIINLNDYYAARSRGWWTVRGYAMAGPYVRYNIYVPSTKMVFCFEGFVYKPNLDTKVPSIRMIEAIAQTIR